ncbi:MAG: hypothetical protein F4Z55_02965 [Boseongicola sp. SB0667_bin_21]|nr:hypothetical protein [Boseongicola sp. SB0667_bin_21]
MPARHCQNAEDITDFQDSISPVGWFVVPIPVPAVRFDVGSRTGASRLDEDQIRKQAGSASYTPPPRM